METLEKVISLDSFREVIQDKPKRVMEKIPVSGDDIFIQLNNTPIYNEDDLILTDDDGEVDYESLDKESGLIEFASAPEYGIITAVYYTVQLSDSVLVSCLTNALTAHAPGIKWEDFFEEEDTETDNFKEIPFITLLAASSACFILSSKWATKVRVRTDDLTVNEDQVAGRYLELGRWYKDMYKDSSSGMIDVQTLTRRALETGELVPLPEDWYDE